MQFSSLAEFIAMGNHGLYVWSAYGISVVLIGLNVVLPILKKRQLISQLRQSYRREK
ncbi:MAG: heme exporter protein CcmD [Gammaproteobacteria bacterium]|nr:MAG: heme exporter protein CcmD [Gammaproteobacteria bacterium]